MLIESRYIVSSLFISTVILFLGWIAALVGKSEAFEKHVNWWRQQRLLKRAAVVAVLIGVIAYAGTKPDPSGGDDTGGSSTNDVTQVEGDASNTNDVGWIEGDLDGTNDVDQVGGDTNSVGGAMLNAPRPMFGGAPSLVGRGSVLGTPVAGTEGFSLVSVGHDETFDFTPPETAVVATNWLLHGASTQPLRLSFDDWVFPYGGEGYSNFTVFAYGEVMPGEVNTNHFLVPFGASLGIAPMANWHLLSTNSNPNNLTIEQSNNSLFWSGFSPSNTLLLTWQNALLDRAVTNPVSFQAELKPSGGFVFRYDLSRLVSDEPLSNAVIMAQSEDAGFADAPTTNLTSLAFHTHDEQLCDENREDFDEKIGDENPYAYPEGSTNTVLEHVFYSGTTNGTFAYPQSTDGNAVLMVSVSGSGSGELLVGSKFVPLVGRPAPVSAPRLFAAPPPSPSTLAVTVPRGSTQKVYMRGDSTLSVSFSSDDFAFGELPDLSGRHFVGSINFPFVNATVPCIHDYNAKKKLVSLPLGGGAGELTCEWQGTSQIEVENIHPVSAMLTGRFSGRTTTPVTYTLSHPNYLFGQTTYSQTARYCPQPPEEDDDDDPPSGDPSWYDGDDDDDDEEHYCWCCFWGSCYEGCGCGCACDIGEGDDEPDEPVDPEPEDYDEASTNYPHMSGVLKIRDPLEYTAPIHLTVPLEHRNCCPCPDHATNWVSVVYKSNRLKVVDAATEMDFHSSGESLDVKIAGVSPSFDVGDAGVSFAANGDVCLECAYTVLGVGIKKSDVDLRVLNDANPYFGLPIPVCSNDERMVDLYLETNVRLPSGNIHIGFENAVGDFALWVWDSDQGGYRLIADTDSGPLDISFAGWKALVGGSSDSYSSQTPIYITSTSSGVATLVYRYWGVFNGGLVEDVVRQTISSIDAPLMVDYDRDGRIDERDDGYYEAGVPYRFWTNPVIERQGDAANELMNFFPVKVDVSRFVDAWRGGYTITLRNWDADIRFCVLDGVGANDVSAIWTEDVQTYDHALLASANPMSMGSGGVRIDDKLASGQGVMAVTAGGTVGTWSSPEIVVHLGEAEVYSFRLPMSLRPVRDMYRFFNIRGCCGDDRSVQTNSGNPVNLPDDETDGRHFVFVHGYSVDPDDARVWADTMFKRLLLSGSRSAFTAVTWFGDYSKIWESVPLMGGKALNYYRNVQNAFNSASPFKTVYDGLSGNKVILAHSLGNMLVSSAIVDHGLNDYGKYYMLNAAVPMEAYNEDEYESNMIDHAWLNVQAYSASRWYQWFDLPDFRAGLTWKGRFGNIPRAENCYSPTEDVLSNPSAGGYGNAWGAQELLKGTTILHAANLIGSNISVEGGWGINSVYATESDAYLPIIGFDAMYFSEYTREQAITLPLFTPFDDARMHITNALNVADASLRAKMLGDAIPAESFAAGRNELTGFENYNYQRSDQVDPLGDWRHSDIKDRPFRYVSDFFKHIMETNE